MFVSFSKYFRIMVLPLLGYEVSATFGISCASAVFEWLFLFRSTRMNVQSLPFFIHSFIFSSVVSFDGVSRNVLTSVHVEYKWSY